MSAEIIQFPHPSEADTSAAIKFWIAMGRLALTLDNLKLAMTALESAQRLNREQRS